MWGLSVSRTKSLWPQLHPIASNFSSSTPFPAIPVQDNANAYFHPTVKSLFKLLNQRRPIYQIKQIHAQILTLSLSSRSSLTNSLIHCYLFANQLSSAKALFNAYPLPSPPILVWNIMIRAYSKLQSSPEPINIVRKMLALDHPFRAIPDDYTFTFFITSCAHQVSLVHGVIAHGLVIKNGYFWNLYVANSLVNMYGVFKRTNDAFMVFDEMPERDVFSWTSLVCGYAKNGEMWQASEVFGKMPVRNDVSWAVMVSGYAGSGKYIEALRYFHEMLSGSEHKVKPNEAVLVSSLSACAHLGALEQGNWIHNYIDRSGIPYTSNVLTSLVDMYAKCGRIDCAELVFNKIKRPDVDIFTSMISGLSIHGLGKHAFTVFNRMLDENISPNEVTILGVLNGCSHSGLVEEGSAVFNNMETSWGIEPKIKHYGCYVDLLGRAGYLEKAFEVVQSMPMEPDIILWRALLSACRIHRNADLGESIINYIKGLGSRGSCGGEVLLSNLYASLGRWEKVAQLRKAMEMGESKNQSYIGCSWIEVNGVVHEFRVAEKLHPQILEIQEKLKEVLSKAHEAGYVANTMRVSFDLIEEEKEHAVAWHSEKLAVAYGLMSTIPGTTIRIVKNLRTCEDCHSAFKAISKVYRREIIVRDRCRFHTFKEGNCLCNDYW